MQRQLASIHSAAVASHVSRHFGKRARQDPGHIAAHEIIGHASCSHGYRSIQADAGLLAAHVDTPARACFREGRHQGMTRFSASSIYMRASMGGKKNKKRQAYTRGRFLFREAAQVAAVSLRGRREQSLPPDEESPSTKPRDWPLPDSNKGVVPRRLLNDGSVFVPLALRRPNANPTRTSLVVRPNFSLPPYRRQQCGPIRRARRNAAFIHCGTALPLLSP